MQEFKLGVGDGEGGKKCGSELDVPIPLRGKIRSSIKHLETILS